MVVDGLAGLVAGPAYDRIGPVVLVVVPVAAGVAATSFASSPVLVWVGVAVWGLVNGVLDSVVKAVVTELVGPESRSTAFGWLALVRGSGLLAAGAVLGVAYGHSPGTAVAAILTVNALGLLALAGVLRAMLKPNRTGATHDATTRTG